MKLMEQELYVVHYSLISRPWEQKRSILTSSLSMPVVVSSRHVQTIWQRACQHDIDFMIDRKSDVIKQDQHLNFWNLPTSCAWTRASHLSDMKWSSTGGELFDYMLSLEITFFILLLMQHLIRIVDITVLDRLSSEMSSRHLADDLRVNSLSSSLI